MKKHNTTRYVILGLLSINPMSGYEMRKFIGQSIGHFWQESNGQLYPTLENLEEEGLITSEKVDKGKKSRFIYTIGKKGHKALSIWLKEKAEKMVHRDEGLLKLFFGTNTSKEVTIQRLKERKDSFQELIQEFSSLLTVIEKYKKSPHFVYWVLTLKNGLISAKAEVEWCEEAIKTIEGCL